MTRRVSGGYLATDVLERIARSIADATGGRAEVWGAQGAKLGRWASWPSGSDESADPVHLTEPLAIAGRKATFPVRHRGQVLGAITVIKPAGEPIRPPEHRLLVDLAELRRPGS